MKSNKMKKIVAFICVFTMLLNMLPLMARAAGAMDVEIESYSASEIEKPKLTAITMADFNVKRGNLTEGVKTYNKGDSLINTVLVQKMTFSELNPTTLYYAGPQDWEGRAIQITVSQGGINIYYVTKPLTSMDDTLIRWNGSVSFNEHDANNTSLVGQERTWKFELFQDPNNEADALFGISVDGILLGNQYFVCQNGVEALGNKLMASGDINVGNPALASLVDGMKAITMSDFNIKKGTYQYNTQEPTGYCVGGYGKYNGSLINTVLTQKMTFSDHAGISFYIGTCDDYAQRGIRIETQRTADWNQNLVRVYNRARNGITIADAYLGARDAQLEELFGKELVWQFELFQDPNNEANALLGIYVEGNLLGSDYITVEGGVENLGTSVTLQVEDTEGSIEIGAPVLAPDNMVDITAKDFNIDNNKYLCSEAGAPIVSNEYREDSLLGTTFTQKMTFSEHADTRFWYAGPVAWRGIRFLTNTSYNGFNVSIILDGVDTSSVSTYDLTPESVGQEKLLGIELEWKLELFQDPYNAEDVLLGVYIEDTLWNNTYMRFKGIAQYMENQFGIDCATLEGWVRIGEQEPAPVIDPNFAQLSASSYGVQEGVYAFKSIEEFIKTGTCGREDMNEVVFSDTLYFSKGTGAKFTIGGRTEGRGIHWTILGENLVAWDWCTNETIGIFTPATAGVTSFVDNPFKLTLSFEYIDHDGDGSVNDIKLGVWFDDKSYDDSWIYIKNTQTGEYGEALGIISTNPRAYIGIGREVEVRNLDTEGVYTITGDGSFIVNGAEVEQNHILDKPGDYLITCTTDTDSVTKHVFLYSSKDAHPDGEIDVKDLVAVKKVMCNKSLTTFAGTEAADTDTNGQVNETDRTAVCDELLQK